MSLGKKRIVDEKKHKKRKKGREKGRNARLVWKKRMVG